MAGAKVSKENYAKMLECKTAAELKAFCATLGQELSMEEAESFLAQNMERELTPENMENVAGGFCLGAFSLGCIVIGIT